MVINTLPSPSFCLCPTYPPTPAVCQSARVPEHQHPLHPFVFVLPTPLHQQCARVPGVPEHQHPLHPFVFVLPTPLHQQCARVPEHQHPLHPFVFVLPTPLHQPEYQSTRASTLSSLTQQQSVEKYLLVGK